MSTAAAKHFPVVSGSAARDLTGLKSGSSRARTPLSVVHSSPRKRRAPFVVLCFALLAIALVAVLILNISVSTSQYQLVQLRGDHSRLTKENQDLTQRVQNFEAPQNVAAKAAQLGMVPSTGKGQIDLATLTVTGKAQPAVKGAGSGAVIPAPAVAGQLLVVPPATSKDPLASRKVDGGSGTGAPAAPQPAPGSPQPAPAAPPAAAPAPDLHGGSVPAPQQKSPDQ